jgi:DNA-binding cell septation regulator SpoVG
MAGLKITNVNVAIRGKGDNDHQNVLGFAEVVISDALVIKNIKIIKCKGGKRKILSFPAQMTKESKRRYDICYPINKKTRDYFEKVIFNVYDKLIEAQPQE